MTMVLISQWVWELPDYYPLLQCTSLTESESKPKGNILHQKGGVGDLSNLDFRCKMEC